MTSTSKGAKVKMPAGRKFNLRNKASSINMRVELTRISRQDGDDIVRAVEARLTRELRDAKQIRRRKVT